MTTSPDSDGSPDSVAAAAAALAAWRGLAPAVVAGLPRDGDVIKDRLLHPALLRGLGELADRRVLDVGCGTGELARLLARRGARVTALDPSPALLAEVRRRSRAQGVPIETIEAAVEDARGGAPPARFDAVTASLVLNVVGDLTGAVSGCVRALRPGGVLAFAVEHPCFDQALPGWTRTGIAEVTRYLGEYEVPGLVAPRFHRPLSGYLDAVLAQGCDLIRVAEPGLDAATLATHPQLWPLRELPLFLVVLARKRS